MTSASTRRVTTAAIPEIKPIAELKGHVGAVTAVVFTEDGSSIATAGQDARLKIWNASSGNLVRTIELDDGPATALALSGSRVLTGHASGQIVLWDIERAEKIATFKRNEAEVWSLVFAGRPDRFAASSHDWKVALWDTSNTSAPVQVLDAHDSAAQAVAFSAAQQAPLLASGGADKTVKLWNLDTFDRVRTYRGHRDFVTTLAFSPNGKWLASAGLDGTHPHLVDGVEPPHAPPLRPPRPRRRARLLAVGRDARLGGRRRPGAHLGRQPRAHAAHDRRPRRIRGERRGLFARRRARGVRGRRRRRAHLGQPDPARRDDEHPIFPCVEYST